MTRTIDFVKHNAIAIAALFIALGGTSYAAVSIPKGSVGTRQLRRGAVTPSKLSSRNFRGRIIAVTEIENGGAVLRSNPKGVTTSNWTPGSGGFVNYPHRIPRGCFPVATPAQPLLSTAQAVPQVAAGMASLRSVQVTENGLTQLTLEIVCVQ